MRGLPAHSPVLGGTARQDGFGRCACGAVGSKGTHRNGGQQTRAESTGAGLPPSLPICLIFSSPLWGWLLPAHTWLHNARPSCSSLLFLLASCFPACLAAGAAGQGGAQPHGGRAAEAAGGGAEGAEAEGTAAHCPQVREGACSCAGSASKHALALQPCPRLFVQPVRVDPGASATPFCRRTATKAAKPCSMC